MVDDARSANALAGTIVDVPRSLRGPAVAGVGRRFWLVVSALALGAAAVVLVASFVTTASDNARITRLKSHGIPVAVTVTTCFGNLAGSGSNVSSFTCHGRYTVGAIHFEEVIGSKTGFSPPGSLLRGVVDPSHHDTLVLARALRVTSTSSGPYVVEGVLSAVWLVLALFFVRVTRRSLRSRRSDDEHVATP
jgi:hypothetical protein